MSSNRLISLVRGSLTSFAKGSWSAARRLDRRFAGPVATRVRIVAGLMIGLYAFAALAAPHTVLPAVLTADGTGTTDTWTEAPNPGDPGPNTVIAPAPAAGAATSEVTAEAKGEFAGLKVTVSQTTNLINQVVKVTWTGGKPTIGNATDYQFDYLQIMQCWGDSDKGPDRTQCQFGAYKDVGSGGENRGGEWVPSRKLLKAGEEYVDPLDKDYVGTTVNGQVPFYSVVGNRIERNPVPGFFSDFDRYSTNEIVLASTAGDGTGEEDFEVETFQEAPGLGCGKAKSSTDSSIRNCWLVVVPRGETEVNGDDMEAIKVSTSHKLTTSPLSATNWANRIAIPLQFQAVGSDCALGSKEAPLLGVETASEVILRWQPKLCANGGPVFGWSKVAGSIARTKLTKDDPAMVLLNSAIDPGEIPEDRSYVYAPVAISGITFGALIQRAPAIGAPASETELAGKPIKEINLTPRVAAKLLTQSYRYNVAKDAVYLSYPDGKPYPDNLTRDPDFLKDNPAFAPEKQSILSTLDILTPLTTSASNRLVWEWIAQDQDATDFLAGQPDPYGMRVNPFYQGISVPQDGFPKSDPYCDYQSAVGAKPKCTFDSHPYAIDYQEIARSVVRGDSLARGNWDAAALPPGYKKSPPSLNGIRRLLGVSDSASAARYGLVSMKLRNASGAFVGPTDEGLLAGVAGMRKSAVTGVVLGDPTTTNAAAYPLTTVTYAVTAPVKLTSDQAANYSYFLKYVAGNGQNPGTAPGTLPDGYVPLTAAMKAQTLAAATDVANRVGPPPTTDSTSSSETTSSSPTDSASPSTSASPTASATGSSSTSSAPVKSAAPTSASPAKSVAQATNSAPPASPAPAANSPAASPPASPAAGAPSPAPAASPSGSAAATPTDGSTGDNTGQVAQRLTPKEVVGWTRYVTVIALLLGTAAALLGPALPRLVWRLEQRGATPTRSIAPPQVTPGKTDEGTQRVPDDAMATSA